MKYKNIAKRSFIMIVGLFVGALGFSFALKADFGVSAMGCCPAVFCIPLGISVGTAMWLFCAIFIIVQIIILRKEFPPLQLFQIVVAYLFGYFSDFTSILIQDISADTLFIRLLFLLLGLCCTAGCVFLLLKADLLMMAPEAMLSVISKKYNREFSKMKVIMDCSMVAVATAGSLIILGTIAYIGIGTLASATLVGHIVGFMLRRKRLNAALDKFAGYGDSGSESVNCSSSI